MLLTWATATAWSAEFYVATTGSDAGPGSIAKPWRTIQNAANRMKPGDTCVVRAGTYREAVRVEASGEPGSPIRFVTAKGETVVLDGAEPIAGEWQLHSGNIYKTRVPDPIEQLFVDGKMQIEARWPDMRIEEIWDRSKWAESSMGSRKDLMVCPALAKTNIDWTGAIATLNIAHQYKTWTRTVTHHTKGSDRFQYALAERLGDGPDRGPTYADDYFYLSGKLEALDAPTEWFHDADSGVLYLWADDGTNPAGRTVRYKKRNYGFDLLKCRHVEISGFLFVACTFRLLDCTNCVVDGCRAVYPSYSRRLTDVAPKGERKNTPCTSVQGTGNIVRNTSVVLSNTGGISVRGEGNIVDNCIVHEMNWSGNFIYAGIGVTGTGDGPSGNVVRRCTVYGMGNVGIMYYGPGITIEYNHVYDTGRTCRDIAAVHTGSPRARGSVARHNWIHDSTGLGMRGDDQTRGLTFHHNVIWRCNRGMIMKGNENKVYNNTVFVDPSSKHSSGSLIIPKRPEPKKWWTRHKTLQVQNENTLVCNNAAFALSDRRNSGVAGTSLVSHNVTSGKFAAAMFKNVSDGALTKSAFDFRPRVGSPLIDAGRVIPGLVEEFEGKAPDAGAYEFGGENWRAGADWQDEPCGVELVVGLEPPGKHGPGRNIPMPKKIYKCGISEEGIIKLQTLYAELWARDGRGEIRSQAIQQRQQHKKDSPEWQRHHAVVARLHRDLWHELRDKGATTLTGADRAAFSKAMGGK